MGGRSSESGVLSPRHHFTILSSKPVLRGRQAVAVLAGSTTFSYLDLTMDQINQRTWRLQYLNVTHSVRNHFRYPYRCKIPITKGNSRLVGTHMGPKHITGMSGTNFKPTAGEESRGAASGKRCYCAGADAVLFENTKPTRLQAR